MGEAAPHLPLGPRGRCCRRVFCSEAAGRHSSHTHLEERSQNPSAGTNPQLQGKPRRGGAFGGTHILGFSGEAWEEEKGTKLMMSWSFAATKKNPREEIGSCEAGTGWCPAALTTGLQGYLLFSPMKEASTDQKAQSFPRSAPLYLTRSSFADPQAKRSLLQTTRPRTRCPHPASAALQQARAAGGSETGGKGIFPFVAPKLSCGATPNTFDGSSTFRPPARGPSPTA